MKKVIALLMALAMALTLSASAVQACEYCEDVERVLHSFIEPEIRLVTMADWTDNGVYQEDRDGLLYVVKMEGTVVNGKKGDGTDTDGGYIAYDPGKYEDGTHITTWLLANPETKHIDDFIARWDEIAGEEEES